MLYLGIFLNSVMNVNNFNVKSGVEIKLFELIVNLK